MGIPDASGQARAIFWSLSYGPRGGLSGDGGRRRFPNTTFDVRAPNTT